MAFNKKGNQYINNPNLTLQIGINAIDEVTFTKFLGLYIDNKLQWTNHIKHCKSKIASSVYAIRAAKHVLSYEHMRTFRANFTSGFKPGFSVDQVQTRV